MKKEKKENTVEHYNAILLEEIHSQMKFVIEGMQTVKNELSAEIKELDKRLTGEIRLTQQAIKTTRDDLETKFKELKKEFGELKEDVGELKEEVGGLKEDVGELKKEVGGLKEDVGELKKEVGGLKEDMSSMEGRLTKRIDAHNDKLTDHDNRISVLENGRI